jgi:hypothetical protein
LKIGPDILDMKKDGLVGLLCVFVGCVSNGASDFCDLLGYLKVDILACD